MLARLEYFIITTENRPIYLLTSRGTIFVSLDILGYKNTFPLSTSLEQSDQCVGLRTLGALPEKPAKHVLLHFPQTSPTE